MGLSLLSVVDFSARSILVTGLLLAIALPQAWADNDTTPTSMFRSVSTYTFDNIVKLGSNTRGLHRASSICITPFLTFN